MTHQEYADEVTKQATLLELKLEFISPAIAICACIEAACNIACKNLKSNTLARKLREVADLLEKTIQ